MEFLNKIGVELEGAWFRVKEEKRNGRHLTHPDSSLDFKALKEFITNANGFIVGEKSGPAFDNLDALKTWLYKEYPHRTNSTGGFHIHVSFKNSNSFYLLLNRKFNDEFIKTAIQFGRSLRLGKNFENRASNKNTFCKLDFNQSNKYQAVNFSAYSEHRTIEIRLFPQCMPRQKAFQCVKFVSDYFENYLKEAFAVQSKNTSGIGSVDAFNRMLSGGYPVRERARMNWDQIPTTTFASALLDD